jgi:hypothetical protein
MGRAIESGWQGPPNFRKWGGPTQGKKLFSKTRPGRAGMVFKPRTGTAFSIGQLFVLETGGCRGFSRRAVLTRPGFSFDFKL